jgi:predicted secreted protein
MTNTPPTCSAVARRRQIRTARVLFAGAAAVATLALFSVTQPASAEAAAAPVAPKLAQTAPSTGGGGRVVAVDDNNNPSSGDIFTQNAQDQSTA